MMRGLACLAALSACGSTTYSPNDVATNPPADGGPAPASAPQGGASGTRTVITPLGLNVHARAASDSPRIGNAAQGAMLTVVDKDPTNGGWYKVHGATATGWITADSTFTSPRRFTLYPTDQHGFSALYLDTWTFDSQDATVLFRPQHGAQTVAVTSAANEAALGPAGRAGYRVTTYDTIEVCGVTTASRTYDREGTPPPTSSPALTPPPGLATSGGPAPPPKPPSGVLPLLAHLVELRITVDAVHALAVDFAYDDRNQIGDFTDFANSLSFPSPQCRGPVPTQAPAAPAPVSP